MSKAISQTYLFSCYPKYEEKLFKAMMSYDRVDKNSSNFDDIVTDVTKRRTTDNMVKVLKSDNIVLLINGEQLDKCLKVFCATDRRSGNTQKAKVFIDCSNIISIDKSGNYVCSSIDIFLAYIFDAMVTYIYYMAESKFVDNASLTKSGSIIFAKIFTYIVDYIYKINSMSSTRYQCMYMAALYYQINILGKALDSPAVQKIARDAADIADSQANIIMIDLEEDDFLTIKSFVEKMSSILVLPKLGIDAVTAKWMHIFGTGTVFALEIFPSFAAMITDACTNAYINNKNTIEKVVGANLMADFNGKLISIGERV